MTTKLFLTAAAAMALVAGQASATTFLDFQVQEGSVPGASSNLFTADKLNGGYVETVTLTSPTTFTAQAYANFGQYFKNDGTTLVSSQLNGFGTGGYGMYAIFGATGTVIGGTSFTGTGGQFHLYIDPNQDTNFVANGLSPYTTTGDADDYEIAFSTTFSTGTGDIVGPPGAFDMRFDSFTLTAAGSGYFVAPNPFYLYTQVNGDIDGLTGTNPILITGDVSAVFLNKLPEPGTLALVGLAFVGLGYGRRRAGRA